MYQSMFFINLSLILIFCAMKYPISGSMESQKIGEPRAIMHPKMPRKRFVMALLSFILIYLLTVSFSAKMSICKMNVNKKSGCR